MKKIILISFLILTLRVSVAGQQVAKTGDGNTVLLHSDGTWVYADSVPLYNLKAARIKQLEWPKTTTKDQVVKHTGFSLLYNEKHEQAGWVAYDLTRQETNKLFERSDRFVADPKVMTGTATDKDYEGSGYDRGHLAPASDMGWSATAMAESFFYSNISPQIPGFNRGIWKRLEGLVRSWAIEYDTVYVVTGPILRSGLPTLGPNQVSVPEHYYKVILDYTEPGIKGIGFILPNISSKSPLQEYAVSVDSVEKLTGIDFFPLLPDDQESLIEKTLCIRCWTWNTTQSANEQQENKARESVQCKGTTRAGDRCRNRTLNQSGFCYHHEGQMNGNTGSNPAVINTRPKEPVNRSSTTVQCSGTTQSGNRCKRMTSNPNGRCYQH